MVKGWREAFFNKLDKLKEVEFASTDLMFKLNEFEQELKRAIDLLVPGDKLEDWYIGYSKRVLEVKNKANKDILFTLLMTLYLFALDSMPSRKKENRYVIVFDNIETFDNGHMTMEISEYVQKCYGFIQKIYGELNAKDTFNTKFTFIISMRTSTFLPFGNKQTNMWGGGKFIKRIEFFDFSVEALVKKLFFLKNLKNYADTFLFKTLYNVLSVMVPPNYIKNALENGSEIPRKERYFTTFRYLPLFNNNYRRAMGYISDALTDDDTCELYTSYIGSLAEKYGGEYDYLINGIRMMITRHIFDDLNVNGYLRTIGFPELSGEEEYSMTRMILEFLYWCEVKHYLSNPNSDYKGVDLTKLIWVFKHFCDEDRIANTLYNLSIYIKRNSDKANALYAWAYLIYFNKLDADLSEEDFKSIIVSVYNDPKKIIVVGGTELTPNQIRVKLSDAGMCFVQYYLRNLEFLMARNNQESEQGALFTLDCYDGIAQYTDTVYKIIKNCIEKIIIGGEKVCKLYGFEKERCIYEIKKESVDVLQCALFIRYQECMDMIREAIDYLDRFRLSYCMEDDIKNETNILLLKEIQKFYELYGYVKSVILKHGCNNGIKQFINIWNGRFDEQCNNKMMICENKRIEKCRPIKNYYACYNENIKGIIDSLIDQKNASVSLYEKTSTDSQI